MEDNNLLNEIREDYKKAKTQPKRTEKKPVSKKKSNIKAKIYTALTIIAILLVGVAIAIKLIADWGAEHQIVGQPIIAQWIKLQLPVRIDDVEKTIIVQPIIEEEKTQEFTPIEQKIVDRWGFKDGIVAIAIFDCGESGLNQYAVSHTGDLGIAQINWSTWGKLVESKGRTSADLLSDVDFNLDIAYIVWDRGDGKEGNGEGSWGDGISTGWSSYNSGSYMSCLR